ncbi:hypothetical protein B723_30930 [Pseudomonas fluorescens NCIMB 11764]|uniref:Uncharacterized protein n=1 Tax=Pseudomonas fluorescens NCIMB 11764 TaxID=1221522 RepID=A0A0K1QXX0_PSEFL|nr:hypothetical protein B723_30930 [Pseudomonas fluorescens NCIMB 11764]
MEIADLNEGAQLYKQPKTIVGASLLAIAVCQSTLMLNTRPSSRAGSLPRWIFMQDYRSP